MIDRTTLQLGRVTATPGVLALGLDLGSYLARHAALDWGDLPDDDKAVNDDAIRSGLDRILSAYNTPKGKIWIITEANRSVTTILLPSEY